MQSQILEMLTIQNALEERIAGPNWHTLGHDYVLAIVMETCEAIDHYGWKWWKATERNDDAVVMELIDIWHFHLALSLTQAREMGTSDIELSNDLTNAMEISIENFIDLTEAKLTFVEAAQGLIQGIAETGYMPMPNFIFMCAEVKLDFPSLHKMYLGKNCLNVFRQQHGYKEGTYVKNWGGCEDNERLGDWLNERGSVTYSETMKFLSATYNQYAN